MADKHATPQLGQATDLHVHESGTPGSPAIVFLHDVGNSGGMWASHMAGLTGYHCLAPDLPGFGRSNRVPWRSRIHTADLVADLIAHRVPARRAHVGGLSLGGSVTHTLLARRPELLDRVVIDGCGALPWRGTGLLKLAVAAVSPFLHTRPAIAAVGRAAGLDDAARADLRAASPRAFRRGFADANDTVISHAEIAADCPTLLVAGEAETRPPVHASNAALAALMPDSGWPRRPGRHAELGPRPARAVAGVAAEPAVVSAAGRAGRGRVARIRAAEAAAALQRADRQPDRRGVVGAVAPAPAGGQPQRHVAVPAGRLVRRHRGRGGAYTWLFNNARGSVLIVVVFHAMSNTVGGLASNRAADVVSDAIVQAVLAAIIVVVFGATDLSRRRERVTADEVTSPAGEPPVERRVKE